MSIPKLPTLGLLLLFVAILGVFIVQNKYNPKDNPYVSSIIVPHHDLVAKQREATFEKIAPRTQNRHIILIAPNHYDNGADSLQTRSQPFTTQYGSIPIDKRLYDTATAQGVKETASTFEIEHGVKALLSDIAKFYPQTPILPIVIKQNTKLEDLEKLMNTLHKTCKDCLLITSADFSHYQPYQLSELHDKLTIRGLQNIDGNTLDTLAETEPMHQLLATTIWAKLQKTDRFVMDQHTNSTELTKDYYAEGTTHIMGWYEQGKPEQPAPSVSFTVTGPMEFSSPQNGAVKYSPSTAFNALGNRVLWGTDLVLGELEQFPNSRELQIITALKNLKFTHIQTSNSVDALRELGVNRLNNPTIINGYRQSLAIFSGKPSDIKIEDIKKNQADNIIIYASWQGISEKEQQTLSHSWIDSGADLVLGSGDSITKPVELYNNRPVVYSQGKFFTSNKSDQTSLIVTGEFTNNKINLLPLLINQRSYQPILDRSTQSDKQISTMFSELSPYLIDKRGGLLYSLEK